MLRTSQTHLKGQLGILVSNSDLFSRVIGHIVKFLDGYRQGFHRIPHHTENATTELDKLNNFFRERVIAHMKVPHNKLIQADMYLAYHHYHPEVIMEYYQTKIANNEYFEKTINNATARKIGLLAADKWNDEYVFAPNQTPNDVTTYLDTFAINKIIDHMTPVAHSNEHKELEKSIVMMTPLPSLTSAKQRLSFSEAQTVLEENQKEIEQQESRKKRKAIKQAQDDSNLVLSFVSDEQREYYQKSEVEKSIMRRELIEKDATIEELQSRVHELEESAARQAAAALELILNCNHRYRFTDDGWHAQNTIFAKYWLGSSSWSEYKELVSCLWPNIEVPTQQWRERIYHDSELSEWEQCMVARMRLRKGSEYSCLSILWGRSVSSIGNYCNNWLPNWGYAGQDLSILDLTPEYLDATMPKEFIDNNMSDICAMVDGKDFLSEVERSSGAASRAGYSDKSSHYAMRMVTWTAPNGLTVEHTSPYYGRSSEQALVELWGKHIGTTPTLALQEDEKKLVATHNEYTIQSDYLVRRSKMKKKISKSVSQLLSSPGYIERSANQSEDLEELNDMMEEIGLRSHRPTTTGNNSIIDQVLADYVTRRNMLSKSNKLHRSALGSSNLTNNDVEEIENANKIMLNQGPNHSAVAKLRQLMRHERLHESFKSGKLSPCLLSEYFEIMKDKRKVYINVLLGAETNPEVIKQCAFPTRLGKFPANKRILGDRGFVKNAMLYPNLNSHHIPQFIAGRKQFSKQELVDDKVTCRLRYIAEVIFSRCTDENILLDVIPRNNFSQISHAIHWAHANANLGKPFRMNM